MTCDPELRCICLQDVIIQRIAQTAITFMANKAWRLNTELLIVLFTWNASCSCVYLPHGTDH